MSRSIVKTSSALKMVLKHELADGSSLPSLLSLENLDSFYGLSFIQTPDFEMLYSETCCPYALSKECQCGKVNLTPRQAYAFFHVSRLLVNMIEVDFEMMVPLKEGVIGTELPPVALKHLDNPVWVGLIVHSLYRVGAKAGVGQDLSPECAADELMTQMVIDYIDEHHDEGLFEKYDYYRSLELFGNDFDDSYQFDLFENTEMSLLYSQEYNTDDEETMDALGLPRPKDWFVPYGQLSF